MSTIYQYPKRSRFFSYFLVALLFFALGWQGNERGYLNFANNGADENEDQISVADDVDLSLFWTVWNSVAEKYIDENAVEKEKMVYGAIKGMVNALDDPYTVFMDPEESREFSDSLEGTLEGIGAELSVEDKNIVIVSPIKDSPAERAGLLPGDIIYKINDELAGDMTLFEAIGKIRGQKGTTVNLTIIRENVDRPIEVSIVRESIELESVTVEELDNGITYLSVNQFNEKTLDEFNKAISAMILKEPKGLIIDLRYNGGGYLDAAVDMLSFLLPSNTEAVKLRERQAVGTKDKTLYTNGNPKLLNVPLVVLVNEGSASASEILAGAIQDNKRGGVMGTQSFGKGTVQEVASFEDGSSIRITIAKWLTPNGRDINKIGITPDMIVELTDDDIAKKYDRQKEEAIKYLTNLK
ncbi:MAG: S41 family peptidase [Candidatus Gracilibacteria bacterium]